MDGIETLLDEVYRGQERMSRDDIYARAVAAELPAEALTELDSLPEGEYSADEVLAALAELGQEPDPRLRDEPGVPAVDLTDDDLVRELAQLHRTRHETLRHGSASALVRHSERLGELEAEYLSRFPVREVEPERLRSGARQRS
jgi:hypothetical protein